MVGRVGCVTAVLALLIALVPWSARATVTDLRDSGVAPYVRVTGGLSRLGQDAFANSDGDSDVNSRSQYQYGGEIGAMVAVNKNVHLRLGAELLQHRQVDGKGTDSGGVEQFSLSSSALVFNPNVSLEFMQKSNGMLRFYGAFGVGYANVNIKNSYEMTAAGTTHFGVGDFDEKLHANVISGMAEAGVETLFGNNATLLVGLGYRYLRVPELKYSTGANTILSPSGVRKGDVALNSDGSKRALDLGGLFAAVSIRFYLKFL